MNITKNQLAPMHLYLYSIVALRKADEAPHRSETTDSLVHKLLIFSDSGEIFINRRRYEAKPNKVYLLPPGTSIDFREGNASDALELIFIVLGETEKQQFSPVCFEHILEWSKGPAFSYTEAALEIGEELSGSGQGRMKANVQFQNLLLRLLEDEREQSDTRKEMSIGKAVDFINRNFRQSINREQLAELAGISADHFTKVFKKKLGLTPLEYLNEVRLKSAKQALLSSKDSFRSIAQNVGYADEFYFSRKFRAATGLSPSQYVKSMKASDRIVSLQHHLTGHLLALGIEPYGALVNSYYPVKLQQTLEIGHLRPDLDKLAAVRPDLILTCELFDEETSIKAKMFEHIAQTVTIPFDDDWRIQLRKISVATNKEKEATDWLERYDNKAERLRSSIEDAGMSGWKVLILGFGNGKLCMFGRKIVGAVIYGDLRMVLPSEAESIERYLEIQPDEIFNIEADMILLTSFKNDGSTQTKQSIDLAVQRMRKDPRWMELTAVRNQAVYSIFDSQHLYTLYSAYSHNLLLDRLDSLLFTDLSK